MAVVDLLFRQAPLPTTSPVDLLFGEIESLPDQGVTVGGALPALAGVVRLSNATRDVTVTGELPGLTGYAVVARPRAVAVVGALPALTGGVSANYDVAVSRPVVGAVAASHQSTSQSIAGIETRTQSPQALPQGISDRHDSAFKTNAGIAAITPGTLEPLRATGVGSHTSAMPVPPQALGSAHGDMLRRSLHLGTTHADSIDLRQGLSSASQDMIRRRASLNTATQSAVGLNVSRGSRHTWALAAAAYRRSLHQPAMVPPPGVVRVVPPVDPCYEPDANMLFEALGPADSHLIFYCENHDTPPGSETAVVPIRSVYIVINTVTLRRVEGNVMLPAFSLSLSIDVDSWTWSFSASLPVELLAQVRKVDGSPVELEARINDNLYRVLAEEISTDRSFGSARLSVSGRGKNAVLASPYSPVLTFANSDERTAQQLMADVLTYNNMPLGWDIDWQLEDWIVPAGVFNANGSYIDGLNAIAGAAGAYLQPHPTEQTMRALLRYPVKPWEWGTVIPDYELPSAVTTQEAIQYVSKPRYNRVYVRGQQQGVNGRVTRSGTAGDLAAPMVTDPLITTAVAARQRGTAILGDTGEQAMVTLRLPVLEETGVIHPGKFVRYTDGSNVKIGLVRGTSVDASLPEVWQSIQVETHED